MFWYSSAIYEQHTRSGGLTVSCRYRLEGKPVEGKLMKMNIAQSWGILHLHYENKLQATAVGSFASAW